MNREDKRKLKKQGLSDEAIKEMELLTSPCTLTEAVQVSRGVAQDVIQDYHERSVSKIGSVVVLQTIHIEVLKNILISKELITESEYEDLLKTASDEYNARKKELSEEDPDDADIASLDDNIIQLDDQSEDE